MTAASRACPIINTADPTIAYDGDTMWKVTTDGLPICGEPEWYGRHLSAQCCLPPDHDGDHIPAACELLAQGIRLEPLLTLTTESA